LNTGSTDVRDIDKEIRDQLSQHYGYKVLERMNAQNILEEQIKLQVEEKKELRQRLLETAGSEEELHKIEEDVKKLNDLFTKMRSKRADTPDQPAPLNSENNYI